MVEEHPQIPNLACGMAIRTLSTGLVTGLARGICNWDTANLVNTLPTIDSMNPFHLAFPVHDLEAARAFYGGLLECPEGRSSDSWIDFDLHGHQVVAHLDKSMDPGPAASNPVDGHQVPVPHFGVVLEWTQWHNLADRLREHAITFIIEPYTRFEGKVGEQATMFFQDPSGNALEFKSFKNPDQLFAKN